MPLNLLSKKLDKYSRLLYTLSIVTNEGFNMKRFISVLAIAVLATGCSTVGSNKTAGVDAGPVSAINNQNLATTFERQGIKLGWDCKWFTGVTDATCVKGDIKYIEVTGYAPSNGNSEFARETAFGIASDKAKAKLRHFIREDVYSSRVTRTMAKNVEKANDRIKNRIKSDEEVSMSEDEASKDTNYAIRENANDTVRSVAEVIRVEASGILKGVRAVKHQVVDRQTVAVTIRWDRDSENASEFFSKKFR